MNILMVNPNVALGGAQKIMLYLARGLEERGHRVFILTTEVNFDGLPPFVHNFRYIECKTKILEGGGELAQYTMLNNLVVLSGRLLGLRRRILRVLSEYSIDVVNAHNPPANWLCASLPVPVVWSCHNNPISIYRNLRSGYSALSPSRGRIYHRLIEAIYEAVDWLIVRHGVDHIVALSEKIRDRLRRVYGRESEVIVFAPSDEDESVAAEDQVLAKFDGIKNRTLKLVQVGKLTQDKRPDASLAAVCLALRRFQNLELVFVGDGPLRKALAEQASVLGLAGRVRFVGFKGERELGAIYREAHVLLFPGEDQPLGIVPIEAVRNYVVPIVSGSSGVAPLLEAHGCGLLSGSSPEELAERIVYAREHMSEIAERLSKGRDSLAREVGFETFISSYERVFQRVASGDRRRRSARAGRSG